MMIHGELSMNIDSKDNIETLAELRATIPYLEKWWEERFEIIENKMSTVEEIREKQLLMDKQLWEITRNVSDLTKTVSTIHTDIKDLKQSIGISNFLKHNWWKLAGFIVACGTILGSLVEYFYRNNIP
jgi:hypothetical protein